MIRGTGVAGRAQDAMLAILAVAVISLMVLPMPPAMLDLLISINIGLSVLLLMMSIYVNTPLGLSTFPTLLLFTTLLRLSLNIASTRAILLHADAGQIIDTFGQLVVGGSIIVGVVVFLIIAIVQFIVIAKGAERVAEVGARFTLDALPGKQMSIDAELRAGIIDKDESREKRAILQRESQLYGAMDGAMKFVKGDAIAGLLIALVNILAGISVGLWLHEMDLATATSTYTILTVGDGLVSQIPSLFVSLAAGVLITRVSDSDSETPPSLGEQIGLQVGAQPKALMVTAAVLLLFLLVPGFPKFQFLFWAALLGGLGFLLHRIGARGLRYDPMSPPGMHRDGIARPRNSADLEGELVSSYALALRLSTTLLALVEDGSLSREIDRVRDQVTRRLGVPFPGIVITADDQLPDDHFLILVNEIPVTSGRIEPRAVLTQAERPALLAAGVDTPAESATAGARGGSGLWLPLTDVPSLDAAGIEYRDAMAVLGRALARVLAANAHRFIGLQETRYLLGEAERAFPDLVAEATRNVPLARTAEVLRRLVEEGVPIRNMRDILQGLLEWSPKEKDPIMLTEFVRGELRAQITYQIAGVNRVIHALLFSRALEEKIRAAIQKHPGGNFVDLSPAFIAAVARDVSANLRNQAPVRGVRPVVLVSMDIRRYVRQILVSTMPDIVVVSYQNVSDEAQVRSFGEVDEPAPGQTNVRSTESRKRVPAPGVVDSGRTEATDRAVVEHPDPPPDLRRE